MNISNIDEGKIYKNYKELCNVLGIKVLSGNSKRSQHRQFDQYFRYNKVGHYYIINEVYSIPKIKEDLRTKGNNTKYDPITLTHPNIIRYLHTGNNIELNQVTQFSSIELHWVCSKCNEIFLKRIDKICISKNVHCSICSMSEGARIIYNTLNKYGISFEREYSFNDLIGVNGGLLRFDFIINHNGSTLALIEYDGEYHDKELNNDSNNYDLISKHDKLKDEYCLKNNIRLIRINYKHKKFINYLLLKNLLKLNINKEIKESIQKDYYNEMEKIIDKLIYK